MAPSDDIVLPPIHATTAWVLFGLCAALLFYGVMLCQGRSYFRTYREDPVDLKVVVAAILFANGVNLSLIMHTHYYYTVVKSLDPHSFGYVSPSLAFAPFCIFFCIVLCEYVYVRRTYYVLSPRCRWIFAIFAVVLIGIATIFVTILTVHLAREPTFEQYLKIRWLVSASFGCSVVGDLVFACILSLALHVSRTGLKRTDAVLNSIIINAFQSGIFTSMLSILCLLVAVFEGRNLVIIPLSLALAKVYASATLVTLNIRRDLSERLVAPGASGLFVGSLTFFHCALRQSERSEGDAQVLEGCGQVTLAREV